MISYCNADEMKNLKELRAYYKKWQENPSQYENVAEQYKSSSSSVYNALAASLQRNVSIWTNPN